MERTNSQAKPRPMWNVNKARHQASDTKPARSLNNTLHPTVSRESIISAATEMFARDGYRSTSLDQVAAKLGVRKASLYHHICSKEDLLLEICNRSFSLIEPQAEAIAALDLPLDERLRRMIHAHIAAIASDVRLHAVVARELPQLSSANKTNIRRRQRAYKRIWELLFEEGQKLGILRPMNVQLAVIAILGMCNWMCQWYEPGSLPSGQIASVFTLLAEFGWLARSDTRHGTWPRPFTVEEPFQGAVEALTRLKDEVDRLSREIDNAKDKLRDGLADTAPKRAPAAGSVAWDPD